nr:PREDICTED: flocculation protein FLO11-like [Paralichthys olivaceus]
MAEARSEEEEENMRESREQVVRRQPHTSGGRPDRRKPEHRHSQGPLSSIRAAIKRTSTRSTSLSETSTPRERDRDRERDRRRPEITILSAEPLASTSWFPGASGGFPPPPPPAAQIWGPTIPPSIQPPPSYEEVIREKTQEQVLLPSSSSSSSSSSTASRPISTTTIATQTDPGSAPDPLDPQVRRPVRPPRPSPHPHPPKSSHIDDITTTTTAGSRSTSLNSDCVGTNTEPEKVTHASAHAQRCDVLTELSSPLTSTTCAQTVQGDPASAVVDSSSSSQVPLERPRPRPRSKLGVQPISRSEVKVQTLVKLREDGLATLAARAQADTTSQEVSQGKYLQELLEAFSSDDWGFPDHRSDSSGHSQSESEEEDEDMAELRARIQAFEQQQVADGSCGDSNDRDFVMTKRPEPRPRPRLQPAKSAPPIVAPKPKNFSHTSKPSSKVFWEDGGLPAVVAESAAQKTNESLSEESNAETQTSVESTPCVLKPAAAPSKPSVAPKPQCPPETLPSSNIASPASAPVPAPRPPPPKLTPSLSDAPNPKPPPRPPVAPRACTAAAQQDKSTTAGQTIPTLPPRPSVEVSGGAQAEPQAEETPDDAKQTVKVGSLRPGVPAKPAALTSPRRASGKSVCVCVCVCVREQ